MVCRSVWLAEMTCWSAGRVAGSRRGPVSRWCVAEQLVDLAGDPHAGVDEHDQVVADPLEVGDQVRGQHDADLVLGDGLHQVLQELAPRQRVEAGDRLVEDQQLGPLGDGQGEGELGALAAGQLAGPLAGIEAEPLDPAAGQLVVPARVEVGAEPQVVGDGQPGVGGRVLGDEADPGQLRRAGGRPAAEDLDRAGGRRQQPDGEVQQGGLARTVRADQPDDAPGRDRSACSRSAPSAPYRLPSPRASRTAVTLLPPERRTERCPGTAPRCSRRRARPGAPWPASAAGRGAAARGRPARRRSAVAVTKVPTPGRAATRPSCSSSR